MNTQIVEIGSTLACMCCAQSFKVWEDYETQGGEKEGQGVCKDCQDEATRRLAESLDSAVEVLSKTFTGKNKEVFDKMPLEKQRQVAAKMIAEKKLKFKLPKK